MAAMAALNLANLDFTQGEVNPSGISSEIYFALKSDIKTWPTIINSMSDAEASIAKYAGYTGNFAMETGKTFHRLYSTQGKGKVTSEPMGEKDCKMFTNKASFSFPKITDEAKAFSKIAVNSNLIYLVKHDGKFVVVGSPDYDCTTSSSLDSGDAAGSAKGCTIAVECPDVSPLPTYGGTIVCEEGTLDCSTGLITAGA